MVSQAARRAETVAAILAAARKLFATQGFEATSIDGIAAKAGVAKGAVYHHFDSKETIFTQVLDAVQGELAAAPPKLSAATLGDPLELIVAGVLHYLLQATMPGVKRILLIDGPAAIGSVKWREIDDRYFGAGARAATAALLGPAATAAEIDTATHLLLGAVMEAAMVCAVAVNPRKTARNAAEMLRRMLSGLRA